MSQELLNKNNEWALGDLLAIETHLADFKVEGNGGVPHTWCVKKHTTHLLHHALGEAIIHTRGEQSQEYAKFKKTAREVLSDEKLTADKVRDLRNEFREVIGDETLSKKCGTVCSLDKIKKRGSKEEEEEEEEQSLNNSEEGESNTLLWVIGGVIVLGIGLALIKNRA